MSDATQAYSTVIADLRARIAHHQSEIQSLEIAIKVVQAAVPNNSIGAAAPSSIPQGRFSSLGYRRSILIYMAEHYQVRKRLETASISTALQDGGMTTTGQSFTSNVSATLSDMAKKYGEVIRHDDGTWELTDQGYSKALMLIAQVPYSNEQKPLSEQFQTV
jgi:hypothetical protein